MATKKPTKAPKKHPAKSAATATGIYFCEKHNVIPICFIVLKGEVLLHLGYSEQARKNSPVGATVTEDEFNTLPEEIRNDYTVEQIVKL